jgi:hypothetical protein
MKELLKNAEHIKPEANKNNSTKSSFNLGINLYNKLAQEVNEFIVRSEIHTFTINHYFKLKRLSAKQNKKELVNYNLLKPNPFFRLFYIFMPIYFIQSNILLFIMFRKNFTLSKYFGIFLFNILSLNLFCLCLEKNLFFEYISKPMPYSKYMRQEYFYV